MGVSLGFEHSGCVTESGHVYTWGNNYYGRLGLGDENNRYSPTLVEALAGEFCVRSDRRMVKIWGGYVGVV